jgi:type VI secretion system ImpM family protein
MMLSLLGPGIARGAAAFGKVASSREFVRIGARDADFSRLDLWLEGAVAHGYETGAGDWWSVLASAPTLGFVEVGGARGRVNVGAVVSSRDSFGRGFPLAVVASARGAVLGDELALAPLAYRGFLNAAVSIAERAAEASTMGAVEGFVSELPPLLAEREDAARAYGEWCAGTPVDRAVRVLGVDSPEELAAAVWRLAHPAEGATTTSLHWARLRKGADDHARTFFFDLAFRLTAKRLARRVTALWVAGGEPSYVGRGALPRDALVSCWTPRRPRPATDVPPPDSLVAWIANGARVGVRIGGLLQGAQATVAAARAAEQT